MKFPETSLKSKIYQYLTDISAKNVKEIKSNDMDFRFTCDLDDFPTKIYKTEGSFMISMEMTIEINLRLYLNLNNSTMLNIKTAARTTSLNYNTTYHNDDESANKHIIKDCYFAEDYCLNRNEFHMKMMNLKNCAFKISIYINEIITKFNFKRKSKEYLDYFI